MNRIALGIAAVLVLSTAPSWADSETEIDISKEDGEITVESESDGASPNVNVQIGNGKELAAQQRRALAAEQALRAAQQRQQTLDAVTDAKIRTLEAEKRAAGAARAATQAEFAASEAQQAAREADRAAFKAEARAAFGPAPPGYQVIERFEEVRTSTSF